MSGRVSLWALGALCAAICGLVAAGGASANTLPDGRIYEQVTPEEKLGSEAYIPEVLTGNAEYQQSHLNTQTTETQLTFQAAADGSGLAYVAGPTVGGNEDEGLFSGNEYLATRSATGEWSQRVLSPPNAPTAIFQAFTPNLRTAFVDSLNPLSSSAPGFGEPFLKEGVEENYDALYSVNNATSEYTPFFSTKPPFRSTTNFGTALFTSNTPIANVNRDHSQFLAFEGASADYSHLLFAANDALTGASEGRPAAEGGPSPEYEGFAMENNLYESVNGQLRLVNVLPDGSTHANAMFGGAATIHVNNSTINCATCSGQRVISADGSRIFWTDLNTGHIYMRESGATTIEISSEGTYQTATSDGSTVFYINKDLYAYDVQSGHTTDLAPGVTVEKVVGASENGDYIYYLTGGKELMLWHDGATTAITAVAYPEFIRSEVTPDGRSVVFTTREVLSSSEEETHVDVYNAESNLVFCASCTSDEIVTPNAFGSTLPMTNEENVYQPRWITANGDRVFFISVNHLVPQDTNELDDVYEWERPGTGGCTDSTGCVNLLSGGTSTDNSLFLDASENGDDLFIVTRSNFVGGDEDGLYDIYDLRLNAPPAPVAPACSGTGCQGVPSAAPIFATPSSVTFEGVGNFATPAKEAKTKPKPKKKAKPKKKSKRKKKKSKAKKSARGADGRRRSSSKGGRS